MHLFYQPDDRVTDLDEEEGRHCTKVLRLGQGDIIYVTDGRGMLKKCALKIGGRKVGYELLEERMIARGPGAVHMAIAPTRKAERNEWMVEKMVEMGVERIDFVVTANTNRETLNRVVNMSRLNRIAAAAMKQSQQYYFPEISLVTDFGSFIAKADEPVRLIAYVPEQGTSKHVFGYVEPGRATLVLIGPEGDFTPEEVEQAVSAGFYTASLGATRLRTETAAIAACHAVNLAQFIH